jgi:hypothetical protein
MYSLQRLGAGRRDMHSIHPAFERGGGSWPAFSCFLLFTLIALFICGRTRGQTALMGRHLWIALDKRFFFSGLGNVWGTKRDAPLYGAMVETQESHRRVLLRRLHSCKIKT